MATKWVRNNAGGPYGDQSGDSYANAYDHVDDAITYWIASAVKGDIINIVDEGTHPNATSSQQVNKTVTGIGYGDSDFGLMIRGTDAAGDPSMAFIVNTASAGSNLCYFRGAIKYIRIEGLSFDYSATSPETGGVASFQMRDGATGPMRIRDCHFKFRVDDYNWSAAPPTLSLILHAGTPPTNFGEISHCLIENGKLLTEGLSSNPSIISIHHNVIVNKGEAMPNFMTFRNFIGAANDQRFYNNTMYIIAAAFHGVPIPSLMRACNSSATGDYGAINVYNNICFVETPHASTPLGISGFFLDGRTAGSTCTWVGTIDYNILYGGPSIEDGDEPDWYQTPFEQGNGGAKNTNDVWKFEQVASDLFNDLDSTYEWVGSDNGYTITMPEDLRLIQEATSGVGGALPGALPAAATDRSVTNVADDATPLPDDTVVFTIVASNSGVDDTNVEVDVPIPAGLTFISRTLTTGTWQEEGEGTGNWDIGNLNDGASETLTLTFTVDSDQGGNSIDLVATISGDLEDSVAGNDVATETLIVTAVTDLSVTNASDVGVPDPGDTVTFTIVASNSGATDTAVVTMTGLTGLTYASDTPTAGSYDSGTGIWAVGSMADSASETLVLEMTVDSDQSGNTLLVIATVSGDLLDTDGTNNVDSVTLYVADTGSVVDEDNPAAAPFIDVLPLIQPDLRLEVLVRLDMIHKRVREVSVRDDFEDAVWSEFTSKRLVIATNTTEQINLGGVARGEYLMIDATTAVDVSAVRGGTPLYWSGIKSLIVGRGDFEQVHIRNTSTTLTSTILIGVVD